MHVKESAVSGVSERQGTLQETMSSLAMMSVEQLEMFLHCLRHTEARDTTETTFLPSRSNVVVYSKLKLR